jgi:hypothetical protein
VLRGRRRKPGARPPFAAPKPRACVKMAPPKGRGFP